MSRGKPSKYKFMDGKPVNISALVDKNTKLNIEIVAGKLVEEFGYAPTQGEVIDYVFKEYLKKK